MPTLLLGPVGPTLPWSWSVGVDNTVIPFGPASERGTPATWSELVATLPEGGQPEALLLWLGYTHIPDSYWQAPLPIIALVPDWNLQWHHLRTVLRQADFILTDHAGVEAFKREGFTNVRRANLYGWPQTIPAWSDDERPIDVLFVGNFHPAVQRERLPWLGRLAALRSRWNVVLRTQVYGAEYHTLLRQSKIVFNHSIRGECNLRIGEAITHGAVLFQEADNREVSFYLTPERDYIPYTAVNLEERLDEVLSQPAKRLALARSAYEHASNLTMAACFQRDVISVLIAQRNELHQRVNERLARGSQPVSDAGRAWSHACGQHVTLAVREPWMSSDANARGVLADDSMVALRWFERALHEEPTHLVAGLNRAERRLSVGANQLAVEQAQRTLQQLERDGTLVPSLLNEVIDTRGYSTLRVEWERAAWQHAGRPDEEAFAKAKLLRWRLHAIIADGTGDLQHYDAATLAQPELAITQGALGCALARANRPYEAMHHVRQALEWNPFDLVAARALYQLLGDTGDRRGQRRLARRYHTLYQAAPQLVPLADWFATTTPTGDELASLIILCCNNLIYTQQCLTSVWQHTRSPYEIIIIDNGSTDKTPAYLDSIQQSTHAQRVVVIRNEQNLGYAAGVNQGLQAAKGEYIVLLNNDVVVTPQWLDGLIDWSLDQYPSVGLVGAVTNATRPPQQVMPDYIDLAGLDGFARRRAEAFRGQALVVERLTGFCLLVRSEVLAKIGLLDERFGVGFFEDDDLCVRARRAGYQLVVAQQVYVHHYGSRTFAALGIDTDQLLDDNFTQFKAKWGEAEAAGYRRADTAHTPRAKQPLVSLFMMVKNEEHHLPDCLRSVADLVDEMVIIDTGSVDRTKEIAQSFGARVIDFPWVDSFSAARNEGLRHVTGRWAFWMDADDRLDDANRTKLRTLFAQLPDENTAWVMKCWCTGSDGSATVVDHVRLFRVQPEHRWTYRVHEQILPALRRTRANVQWSDVTITHVGYAEAAARGRKLERDLRLLHLEVQEQPDDPFTLFNVGSVYQELGRVDDALQALQRSLELSHPADSIVRKLYATITQLHRQQGHTQEALQVCLTGRELYPDDAELLFIESLLRRELRDFTHAEACLKRLLDHRDGDHFASIDVGLRSYKARHNLAVLYRDTQRDADAATLWQAVLAEEPAFIPAHVGLGELAIQQRNEDQLEYHVSQLQSLGTSGAMESIALRSRWLLKTEQYAAARGTLAQALTHHPRSLALRILHSHALLKEGHDPAAAEAALLAVLELDPTNMEAQHNLAVLRRK